MCVAINYLEQIALNKTVVVNKWYLVTAAKIADNARMHHERYYRWLTALPFTATIILAKVLF